MSNSALKGFKPKLWPILWVLFIFATSSGVVTVRQLSTAVAKAAGPVKVTPEGFEAVWKSVWWIFVKGWHATEFGILAWLIYRATSGKLRLAVGLAGTYALIDELHQVYIPGRGGRMSDVLIDWIGIGLFLLFWHCSWTKRQKAVAFTISLILIFMLSIFPMPTFPLPGAPASHRFNP